MFEQVDIKVEPSTSSTSTNTAATAEGGERKVLRPVKTKMVVKKDAVRQCRLCLRVLAPDEVRVTQSKRGCLRSKILAAVGVRIIGEDKVKAVCLHCMMVVDMIDDFRMTCMKANLLHSTKLMMMHPGSWMSEENHSTLLACQKLIQRNRAEMDGLFKCSRIGEGLLPEVKDKVVKEEQPEDTEEKSTEDEGGKRRRKSFQEQKIVCDVCGMMIQKGRIDYHLNRHLGLKPHRCIQEGCEATFFSQGSMKTHVMAVHRKDNKRYECNICNRMIKGRIGLRTHMYAQHTKEAKNPRKSECNICGKMYYKNFIKDHIARHMGIFRYECEFCDKKFAAKNNWLFHRDKYHKDALEAQRQQDTTVSEDLFQLLQ